MWTGVQKKASPGKLDHQKGNTGGERAEARKYKSANQVSRQTAQKEGK